MHVVLMEDKKIHSAYKTEKEATAQAKRLSDFGYKNVTVILDEDDDKYGLVHKSRRRGPKMEVIENKNGGKI